MQVSWENGIIRIDGCSDFDPVKIFECGQCFRWNPNDRGEYVGVAGGRAARVYMDGDTACITGTMDDYNSLWQRYFDMDRDYEQVRRQVAIDDYMQKASDFGKGIRILRQDRWEALCSFIISQCNNIPRIKKIVETLCRCFGDEIEFEGGTYYTFPTAQRIAELEEADLAPLRCGYRAAYIITAARAVAGGELDMEALEKESFQNALKKLKSLNGIGDKVANCVILFGLHMMDAFPIDVWMKKAIAENYDSSFTPAVFGENAGMAQQYMFYYQRSGK